MTRREKDRIKKLRKMMALARKDRKKALKAGRVNRASEIEEKGIRYQQELLSRSFSKKKNSPSFSSKQPVKI